MSCDVVSANPSPAFRNTPSQLFHAASVTKAGITLASHNPWTPSRLQDNGISVHAFIRVCNYRRGDSERDSEARLDFNAIARLLVTTPK